MKKNDLFANSVSVTRLSRSGIALGCLVALVGSAHAAVTITKNNPQIYSTDALSGFTTDGGDMAGMSVSVTYSDSTVQTAIWAIVNPTSGAATSAGWFTLTQSGDTFSTALANAWTLTNLTSGLAITAFSINARLGNTVFDTTAPNPGTDDSAQGRNFAFAGGGVGFADVTYSDALKLNSATGPVGDLYLQMNVALGSNSLVGAGQTMAFFQDTDNVANPGDIAVIPEPSAGLATALLLVAGLGIRRRRQ